MNRGIQDMFIRKNAPVLIFLIFTFSSLLSAQGDWETIFRALIQQVTGDEVIQSGKEYNTRLYKANVKFKITDGDGNPNNFEDGDTIQFEIVDTSLKFKGGRDGLTNYAENNGSAIYDAIFPSDA